VESEELARSLCQTKSRLSHLPTIIGLRPSKAPAVGSADNLNLACVQGARLEDKGTRPGLVWVEREDLEDTSIA